MTFDKLITLIEATKVKLPKINPEDAYNLAVKFFQEKGVRSSMLEQFFYKYPGFTVDYAHAIIDGRWPEAEPYIMKDPFVATHYAFNVIGERWPEAEPIIKKDKDAWDSYVDHFNIK